MFDKSEINISRVPLGTLVQEKIRTTEARPGMGWKGFHSQDSPKMDGLYMLIMEIMENSYSKWRNFIVFFDMIVALTNYHNRKQLATINNSQHYCWFFPKSLLITVLWSWLLLFEKLLWGYHHFEFYIRMSYCWYCCYCDWCFYRDILENTSKFPGEKSRILKKI